MIKNLFVIVLLIIYACNNPFNTNITQTDVFELKINHNTQRVMPNAFISLSWSEITIENFMTYKIERKLKNDTSWTSINEIQDKFVTSYIDTIWNDEDLLYRVGIVDIDENIIWANSSTNIPRTNKISVPDEFATIQSAFNSALIDDGDTISVKPGLYQESIYILGKDVFINSTHGFKSTILTPSIPDSTSDPERVVTIASGIIDGFTISEGDAANGSGGGVDMSNSCTVQNCFIQMSTAQIGGSVYITDFGNFNNNIVAGDSLSFADGVIYISDAHGEIVNNTIVNYSQFVDEVVINGDCSGLIFLNNIISNYQKNINVEFQNGADINNITLDYSLFNTGIMIGSKNIVGDPDLSEYYFIPSESSPCINAGHPAVQYFDIDGTRNDIGAYGGPYSTLLTSSSDGTD